MVLRTASRDDEDVDDDDDADAAADQTDEVSVMMIVFALLAFSTNIITCDIGLYIYHYSTSTYCTVRYVYYIYTGCISFAANINIPLFLLFM